MASHQAIRRAILILLAALLTLAVSAGGMPAQAGINGQWATKAPMPTARSESAAGAINGQLYVAGGNGSTGTLATLEVYDPSTDTWTAKTSMPAAVFGAASAVINGRLYIAGGASSSPAQPGPFNTLYSYDPAAFAETARARCPDSVTPGY